MRRGCVNDETGRCEPNCQGRGCRKSRPEPTETKERGETKDEPREIKPSEGGGPPTSE